MKLNVAQKKNVENQVRVEALPDEHPAARQLRDAFGDHTFFLDSTGLNIVEEDPSSDDSNGNVVRLASWKDDQLKELVRHEPEVLPITVDLDSDEPDPDA